MIGRFDGDALSDVLIGRPQEDCFGFLLTAASPREDVCEFTLEVSLEVDCFEDVKAVSKVCGVFEEFKGRPSLGLCATEAPSRM